MDIVGFSSHVWLPEGNICGKKLFLEGKTWMIWVLGIGLGFMWFCVCVCAWYARPKFVAMAMLDGKVMPNYEVLGLPRYCCFRLLSKVEWWLSSHNWSLPRWSLVSNPEMLHLYTRREVWNPGIPPSICLPNCSSSLAKRWWINGV